MLEAGAQARQATSQVNGRGFVLFCCRDFCIMLSSFRAVLFQYDFEGGRLWRTRGWKARRLAFLKGVGFGFERCGNLVAVYDTPNFFGLHVF